MHKKIGSGRFRLREVKEGAEACPTGGRQSWAAFGVPPGLSLVLCLSLHVPGPHGLLWLPAAFLISSHDVETVGGIALRIRHGWSCVSPLWNSKLPTLGD